MRFFKNWTVWCIAFLVLLTFSWNLITPGFFRIHDFTHVGRLAEMRLALDAGHFPAIWSQNYGFGYGMPLFLFYGPLPFYLASIISYLGIGYLGAVKITFLLSGVVGFLGMYLLARRFGNLAGLVAATLFIAAPYRAVDIYVRGALNEVWAIAFLPWILLGAEVTKKHPRRGVVITSAAVASLVLTHNLTAFFALPLLSLVGLWSIVLWVKAKERLPRSLAYIGGLALGALLSVFYSIPAFLEKNQTSIDSILGGYFDFRLHFLYIRQLFIPRWGYGGSEYGPNDGISFHLGTLAVVLIGLFVVTTLLRFIHRFRHKLNQKDILHHVQKSLTRKEAFGLSLFAGLGISLFMTLNHALPIWEAISIMSFIQFPWRFLAVAIVFSSLIGGLFISQIRLAPVRAFVAFGCILLAIIGQSGLHQPQEWLPDPVDFYTSTPHEVQNNLSSILPDYIPKTFNQKLPSIDAPERIIFSNEGEGTRYELNQPHQILLFTQTPPDTTVTWNIAHFPGWKYFVNDEEVSPHLREDGRMEFISEEPISNVSASFEPTPLRQATLAISFIAFIAWLTLLMPELSTRSRND